MGNTLLFSDCNQEDIHWARPASVSEGEYQDRELLNHSGASQIKYPRTSTCHAGGQTHGSQHDCCIQTRRSSLSGMSNGQTTQSGGTRSSRLLGKDSKKRRPTGVQDIKALHQKWSQFKDNVSPLQFSDESDEDGYESHSEIQRAAAQDRRRIEERLHQVSSFCDSSALSEDDGVAAQKFKRQVMTEEEMVQERLKVHLFKQVQLNKAYFRNVTFDPENLKPEPIMLAELKAELEGQDKYSEWDDDGNVNTHPSEEDIQLNCSLIEMQDDDASAIFNKSDDNIGNLLDTLNLSDPKCVDNSA